MTGRQKMNLPQRRTGAAVILAAFLALAAAHAGAASFNAVEGARPPSFAAIAKRTMLVVAFVTEVAGSSPAAEAGVKAGDVIVEFNGKSVPRSADFPSIIADTPPGQRITLKLVRDRKEQTVALKIGELPDDHDPNLQVEARDPELGLRVQRITPETARRLGLNSTKGVLVVEVQPGGPAAQVGIEPADVIREVNQRAVSNVKEFARATRHGRRGDRILLLVQRGDNAVFFAVRRKS